MATANGNHRIGLVVGDDIGQLNDGMPPGTWNSVRKQAGLRYAGAARARTHLVVIGSSSVGESLASSAVAESLAASAADGF